MSNDTRAPAVETALDYRAAVELQAVELDRAIAELRQLSTEQWSRDTDCPAWDVRQMYLHVLGACEAGASMKENVHQMRRALQHRRARGGPLEAALSHVQVDERADLSPDDLVERLERVAPRTVHQRSKLPRPMRAVRLKVDGPVVETWSIGYLTSTIYLRDLWMHRIDLSRATDRPLMLTSEHDGRIVADIVAEWYRRHGRDVSLRLAGPAGGDWNRGSETIEFDAVDFSRMLAGRSDVATDLPDVIVPF